MSLSRLLRNPTVFRRISLKDHHAYHQSQPLPTQRRPPSSSSFQSALHQSDFPISHQGDTQNLTRLSFAAPLNLRRKAQEMYSQCKLSEREPTTRFAIARQMRNLDLPPHRELWQNINATDELALYRWIDEAFGQLLYQKGLWKPSLDWGPEDDAAETQLRQECLKLLREAYEDQILSPLKELYGASELNIALSGLRDDEQLYCEPAVIWQSIDRESGEVKLEWMSEYTADVAWPGLVSCQAHYQVARRHWEAEARSFAEMIGGIARGMGKEGEMLPIETEEEKTQIRTSSSNQGAADPTEILKFSSSQARYAAEAILMKKFLEEKQMNTRKTQ